MIAVEQAKARDIQGAVETVKSLGFTEAARTAIEAVVGEVLEQGRYEQAWELVQSDEVNRMYSFVHAEGREDLKGVVLHAWLASGEVNQHQQKIFGILSDLEVSGLGRGFEGFASRGEMTKDARVFATKLAKLWAEYLTTFDFTKNPHEESLQDSGYPYSTWRMVKKRLEKIQQLDEGVYKEALMSVVLRVMEHGHDMEQIDLQMLTNMKTPGLFRYEEGITILAEMAILDQKYGRKTTAKNRLWMAKKFRYEIEGGRAALEVKWEAEAQIAVAYAKIGDIEQAVSIVEDLTTTDDFRGVFKEDRHIRWMRKETARDFKEQWKQETLLKIAEVFAENQLEK
jgi:hypothetical protein